MDVPTGPLATGDDPAFDPDDVPPEFDWDWPDPDCGRPPELAGLTYEELDALPASTPARYRERAWPIAPPSPGATRQPTAVQAPPELPGEMDRDGSAAAAGWPGEMDCWPREDSAGPRRWPGEMDCWLRDGTGGGTGFADGGVLDTAPAGLALAGFTTDAHAQLGTLTDDELTGVIRAWRRLASWASAGELQAIAALARRRPADDTPPAAPGEPFPQHVSEFTGEEVAAALTLTPLSGDRLTGLAMDLATRLAPVRDVLAAGWIDLPRARLFAQATEHLTDTHTAAVVAAVLPHAPGMTSGRLRRALDRAVLAADPSAARQQRDVALAQARVDCWPDPCGTANLAGRNLPAASALAADKRLDAIARTWQRLGAQGGIDQLRARAYLAQLLDQDTTQPPTDLLPPATPSGPPSEPAPATPSGAPSEPAPATPSGAPGEPAPASSASPDSWRDLPRQPDPASHLASDQEPPDSAGPMPAGPQSAPSADHLPPLAGSVNLSIPLTTLLGLADRPGEASGYGPLDADTARALACAAAGHRATRWHITLTGPTGRALGYGSTPASHAHTTRDGHWQINITAEPIAAGSCDHRTAEPQYRPSAALQRIIRARATTCTYYGCARPATRCDLDHSVPYDDDGITCQCNLAPLCRRHHRLKQTQRWTLEQPCPGVMTWLTPAGRRYITLPSQHPT